MPNFIFKDTNVVSMDDDKPVRLTFSPPNLPGIQDLSEEFWITGIRGGIEPNYQILYSFNKNVYLNAFTPRLSVFQLEGIFIPSHVECGQTENPQDSSQKDPAFMQMYWEYNIVDANADPENQKLLTVSFNSIVIRGFLVKIDIGQYSKEGIDGHTFTMHLLGFVATGSVSKEDVSAQKEQNAQASAGGSNSAATRLSAFGLTAVAGGGVDAGGLQAGIAVALAQGRAEGRDTSFLAAAAANLIRSRS